MNIWCGNSLALIELLLPVFVYQSYKADHDRGSTPGSLKAVIFKESDFSWVLLPAHLGHSSNREETQAGEYNFPLFGHYTAAFVTRHSYFSGEKHSVKEYEKSLNLTELLSWQQRGELKRDDHCCE